MNDWKTCEHSYWKVNRDGTEACRHCGNTRSLLESHAALKAACEAAERKLRRMLHNLYGPEVMWPVEDSGGIGVLAQLQAASARAGGDDMTDRVDTGDWTPDDFEQAAQNSRRLALCRRCHVLRADKRHRGMIANALRDGIIPPNWRELVWE